MRPTIQTGLSELIKLPRRCSRLFVSELIALIVILGSDIGTAGVTPVSPTKPPPRVLVLYSDERLLPANIILDESIRATFVVGTKSSVEFHSEFLDATRFPGEEQEQRQRDYLLGKYRERRPDLLIAVSGAAVSFLAKYRAELFTEVPIVYCSVAGDPRPKNPETERIACSPGFQRRDAHAGDGAAPASGHSPGSGGRGQRTKRSRICRCFSGRDSGVREPRRVFLADEFVDGRVARRIVAPAGSHGRALPRDVSGCHRPDVHPAAGAGSVCPGEPRADLRLLRHLPRPRNCRRHDGDFRGDRTENRAVGDAHPRRRRSAEPPHDSESHQAVPMFDWRQLQRWKISEKSLPPGSVVRDRELTAWEQYRGVILATAGLCATGDVLDRVPSFCNAAAAGAPKLLCATASSG